MKKLNKNFASVRVTVESMTYEVAGYCGCTPSYCQCTTTSDYYGYMYAPTDANSANALSM